VVALPIAYISTMHHEVMGSAKSVLWNFGFLQKIGCASNLKIHLLSRQESLAIQQLTLGNCCRQQAKNKTRKTP
jgi:hypothetical protein